MHLPACRALPVHTQNCPALSPQAVGDSPTQALAIPLTKCSLPGHSLYVYSLFVYAVKGTRAWCGREAAKGLPSEKRGRVAGDGGGDDAERGLFPFLYAKRGDGRRRVRPREEASKGTGAAQAEEERRAGAKRTRRVYRDEWMAWFWLFIMGESKHSGRGRLLGASGGVLPKESSEGCKARQERGAKERGLGRRASQSTLLFITHAAACCHAGRGTLPEKMSVARGGARAEGSDMLPAAAPAAAQRRQAVAQALNTS